METTVDRTRFAAGAASWNPTTRKQLRCRPGQGATARFAPTQKRLQGPQANGVSATRGRPRGSALCAAAAAPAGPAATPRGGEGAAAAAEAERLDPADVVLRHIAAFNARDSGAVASLLAPNCIMEGLAYSETLRSKQEVARFYRLLLTRLPTGLRVVVDDISRGGGAVGVTWHLALDRYDVPFGRGLSFYRVNAKGQVCYIRESPEHVAKVPLSSLPIINLSAPLLRVLAPLAPRLAPLSVDADVAAQRFAGGLDGAEAGDLSLAGLEARLEAATREVELLSRQIQQMQGQRSRMSDMGQRLEGRLQNFAQRLQRDPVPSAANPVSPAAGAAPSPAAARGAPAAAPPPGGSSVLTGQSEGRGTAPSPPASSATSSANGTARVSAAVAAPGAAALAQGMGRRQRGDVDGAGGAQAPGQQQEQQQPMGVQAASQEVEEDSRMQEAAPIDISGIWIKDVDASDMAGYAKALDLMQLNTLQKTAALRLFEGLEIVQDERRLAVRFLTVVPFFKVTESFSFVQPATMPRRDLKPGTQTALAEAAPDRVTISINWAAPNAGSVMEIYSCPEPDVLRMQSTVQIGAVRKTTVQVYRKQAAWQPKNSWPA